MFRLSARLSNPCLGHQPSRGENVFLERYFLSSKVVIRGNNQKSAAPLTFFCDLVLVLFLNYVCVCVRVCVRAFSFSVLRVKHPAVNGSAFGVSLAASY